jgi:hypothetical protein
VPEQQCQKDRVAIDEELRTRLHTVATDFPRLWQDPNTLDRERKRLARLLLEDVTLIKRKQLLIHIRFPGGATRTLELPLPLRANVTQRAVVSEIDRLLDQHSYEANRWHTEHTGLCFRRWQTVLSADDCSPHE